MVNPNNLMEMGHDWDPCLGTPSVTNSQGFPISPRPKWVSKLRRSAQILWNHCTVQQWPDADSDVALRCTVGNDAFEEWQFPFSPANLNKPIPFPVLETSIQVQYKVKQIFWKQSTRPLLVLKMFQNIVILKMGWLIIMISLDWYCIWNYFDCEFIHLFIYHICSRTDLFIYVSSICLQLDAPGYYCRWYLPKGPISIGTLIFWPQDGGFPCFFSIIFRYPGNQAVQWTIQHLVRWFSQLWTSILIEIFPATFDDTGWGILLFSMIFPLILGYTPRIHVKPYVIIPYYSHHRSKQTVGTAKTIPGDHMKISPPRFTQLGPATKPGHLPWRSRCLCLGQHGWHSARHQRQCDQCHSGASGLRPLCGVGCLTKDNWMYHDVSESYLYYRHLSTGEIAIS